MNVNALRSVLAYAWNAGTIYDLHAPLAFSFAGEVLEDKRHFQAHELIEARRKELLANPKLITLQDYGAGSVPFNRPQRKISEIALTSSTPERFGKYLLSTADWMQAERILELGANLGIGAAYLASGMKSDGKLISIEGDPQLAEIAKETLSLVHPHKNARVLRGSFDEQLESALQELGRVDLAFIDGHHQKSATLNYFQRIMPWIHEGTVLIFDDIHWSAGMEEAWQQLKVHPRVRMSIDLWRWGILFFDPKVLQVQHLTLAPSAWKPWHMGFFSARSVRK